MLNLDKLISIQKFSKEEEHKFLATSIIIFLLSSITGFIIIGIAVVILFILTLILYTVISTKYKKQLEIFLYDLNSQPKLFLENKFNRSPLLQNYNKETGEVILFVSEAILFENKLEVSKISTTGASVNLGAVNIGSYNTNLKKEMKLTKIDSGIFIISNRKIVFISNSQNWQSDIKDILTFKTLDLDLIISTKNQTTKYIRPIKRIPLFDSEIAHKAFITAFNY